MDFITKNYEWIFSGVGVAIILLIIKFLKPKSLKEPTRLLNKTSSTNNPSNNINITNTISTGNDIKEFVKEPQTVEDERIKDKTRILFIDDQHKEYKMVSILKKAGWKNTNSVKDILDLDDARVLESDIIFVDINGVGRTMFEDQGLGLASALKNKHRNKKIIIYSAETAGDRFHKALREVDDCLAKNAEPYQFINLVESLAKDLRI